MLAKRSPRIAIPMPHSGDLEYAERSIPQYEEAVKRAGGEPVRIALGLAAAQAQEIAQTCDAVLLPGSSADVNPEKYKVERSIHSSAADELREAKDWLLLSDAYELRKPILGICYGLQSLNVFRGGGLIQHIPEFLPEPLRSRVDHEAGKKVAVAHRVEVARESKLAKIAGNGEPLTNFAVNSSHHQSAEKVGAGLKIVGRCAEDGITEAIEGTDPHHFVIAVQWHPERSVNDDEPSRAIFRALVEAAR